MASNALAALEYVNEQGRPEFSVRAWVRDGKGVLFLPYQAEQDRSTQVADRNLDAAVGGAGRWGGR